MQQVSHCSQTPRRLLNKNTRRTPPLAPSRTTSSWTFQISMAGPLHRPTVVNRSAHLQPSSQPRQDDPPRAGDKPKRKPRSENSVTTAISCSSLQLPCTPAALPAAGSTSRAAAFWCYPTARWRLPAAPWLRLGLRNNNTSTASVSTRVVERAHAASRAMIVPWSCAVSPPCCSVDTSDRSGSRPSSSWFRASSFASSWLHASFRSPTRNWQQMQHTADRHEAATRDRPCRSFSSVLPSFFHLSFFPSLSTVPRARA